MKKNAVKLLLSLFSITMFIIPAFAGDLNLSVAASLTDVMTELTDIYAKENPTVKFQNNFAASGALAKQIVNGAPADIYFSANKKWMTFLKDKHLINEKDISTMAYNVLVFVGKPVPNLKNLQDIVKLDKISIGSPKSVPAGEYAAEALKKAGLEKKLEGKLVMAKDVRTCLLYADRGEVDGSFVYKTDAEEMAKNVKILFTVPQNMYSRITYPMALTVSGSKNPEAVAFYKFLKIKKAKDILVKYGFSLR